MKTVLFWMLRYLVIPAGFIFATGLPQFLSKTRNAKKESIFTEQELKTLEVNPGNYHDYFDSLLDNRKKLVTYNQYSAFLYFRDLHQIMMYKEKYRNTFPTPNRFNGGRTNIDMIENEFWVVSAEQWRKGNISDDEISKARNHWLHYDKRIAGPPPKLIDVLIGVLQILSSWLPHVYLRGFPFALILFLIWKLRMKKEFDEEFRWNKEKPQMYFGISPLSFLVSVMIWPIVLGIDIRNRFSEVLKKADVVVRRNSLFTLFSKQEQQLFELGKKMSRQEFRNHLDTIGMTRKHSFMMAMFVTLFLLIIPCTVFPAETFHHEKQVIITSIDYGGDNDLVYHVYAWDGIVCDPVVILNQEVIHFVFYFLHQIGEILNGFTRDVGGVPKSAFSFARN